MLIACEACHRQYDVGTLAPGQHVRCTCGELCTVPRPQVRDVATQHCSSCGGTLRSDDRHCGFCGSEVVLTERGLGDACPSCFKRLLVGARFCSGCGTEIAPQYVVRAVADSSCPRCEGKLNVCETGEAAFHECTVCGGLWLPEDQFQRVTRDAEQSKVPLFVRGGGADGDRGDAARPSPDREIRYLRCPQCSEPMNRKNFAYSGVIIDWCRGHGYWFDAFELEAICRHVAAGGLQTAAAKELRRERSQATQRRRRAEPASLPATLDRDRARGDAPTDIGDVLGALGSLARWILS